MSATLSLKVLTPLGTALEVQASEVSVPGKEGEFGILPSHTPYLALLQNGILSYSDTNRKQNCAIRGGVAEVSDDRVVILTEEVYFPDNIDADELLHNEKEARDRLEDTMDRGGPVDGLMDELAFIDTLKSMAGITDTSLS